MPKIERWDNLPEGIRQHLIDRMRDQAITISDLNQLRVWIESKPEVPEGEWYKDFGSIQDLWPRFVPQDVPAAWPGGQRRVTLRYDLPRIVAIKKLCRTQRMRFPKKGKLCPDQHARKPKERIFGIRGNALE